VAAGEKEAMERRVLAVALVLTVPLAFYGIPYAYAVQTSSSYQVKVSATATDDSFPLIAYCNGGDYATGGGGGIHVTGAFVRETLPISYVSPPTPYGWFAEFGGSTGFQVDTYAVCQTPITVAGIGVPQFGSLYVAIALGAVLYFMLSRRFARRPALSAEA
jgi:hypothetical protein